MRGASLNQQLERRLKLLLVLAHSLGNPCQTPWNLIARFIITRID